ncbi:UL16-binding protein 3 isoform X2 [Artibeus jamaicensis]|uniref:UL16-binding protein 3 isoform X2 n=1 Tax=Artibeus jamaicensis TaxID=9417 RepID=UPI00235A739D|nr:UL16-binding protein 3 isoform X2 [Artibeus jamaicensis]
MIQIVGVILIFLFLPLLPAPAVPHYAHSLQCVFNISFNEQQRCMVKVVMDRMLILEYDCYNDNVIYEKQEVKTRNVSKDMKETLKDVGAKMRNRLAGLKASKICEDFSILQVRLECHSDANGIFSGSWEFLLDGQRFLVFDPKNGKYKADNSNGEKMEKCRGEWEDDEEVNEMKEFLKKILGDCKTWLQDLDWTKVLGTTGAPATAPGAARSKAMTNRPVTSLIPMILTCLITGCVLLQ